MVFLSIIGDYWDLNNILVMPFAFLLSSSWPPFFGYFIQTFMKEKQKELAISEDKYRGLFQNANEGILLLKGSQFRIVDVNGEAERLTGFKKEELLEKEIFDMFSQEEKGKALDYFQKLEEKGEGRTDIISFMKKDGKVFEVDLSCKRIDLGEATFYQMIFRDLTEQRKFEKEIRESKRNLEAIFDGIEDQLSIQSPDFKILLLNRAVTEKHQIPYDGLVGKKCYQAYYHRSFPCEKCPVVLTIETKKPASSTLKMTEDDTTLKIFSYPILNEKGVLISVIEYMQDITEEQRLQEQLIRSEKLAGLGILASGVSHEINNPLTGIMGMTEIALEEEDPIKVKNYLRDILNCGEKIGKIVKGLSIHSQMAKREGLTLVDLNETMENSLRLVQMMIKTESEVIKKFQPVEKIEADLGEIQLAFNHLITNAFQSMEEGGGRLLLSTQSLKDTIEVKIGDNGIGISHKYLNHIFDPFFTTRKIGEGKGLGLNIVYRIVTKYGGSINVESQEGEGTTFILRFPKGGCHEGQKDINR